MEMMKPCTEERDGFFRPGQNIKYYLDKLTKLNCPDDLFGLANELVQMKHTKSSTYSEGRAQTEILNWDGHELYYFSQWEQGCFNRIQIFPSNGYVDWGHGEYK